MKDIYWKGRTLLLLISLLYCFPDFVHAYSLRQFSNKTAFPIVPSNPFTKTAKVYSG